MVDCIDNLNKCKGKCCRVLAFTVSLLSTDMIRYYELHGCKIERVSRTHHRIIVTAQCSQQNSDYTCKLHGTDKKPLICRYFDAEHKKRVLIPENCVYE